MKSLQKVAFTFSLLLLNFSLSFAKTVTVPVHGLCVQAKEPVPLEIEWNENWFLEGNPTVYNHNIARIAALFSELSYVSVEKNPASNPLIDTYRLLGFDEKNIEWNYILDYAAPISGNNQAAYSFASKDIKSQDGTKKLIFVILRGTPLNANEWLSNINVSDTTHKDTLIHEGFFNTAQNLHKSLIYYLLKNKISPDEAVFMITGHSRGAALANLLGVMLENEGFITGERLFVYTFASPNVSQEEKTRDERYNFIWNIVNAEDIVPSVPPDCNNWKWKKFGQTKVLVNFWNSNPETYTEDYIPRINKSFSRLMLREYSPFKTGPFLQIQIGRIMTSLYKTVENYYENALSLRKLAEKIFLETFPDDEKNEDEDNKKSIESIFPKIVQRSLNKNTEGGVEGLVNSFVDMHACETYLSILLNLNEKEAFSEIGSTQILIKGSYDLAIYDDDGKMLAQVLDGSLKVYSITPPAVAFPLLSKIAFGFPENQNLNVVLLKNSILPTVIPYEIEHYDAQGKLLGKSFKHNLFPQGRSSYTFKAGEASFAIEKLETTRLNQRETKPLAKKYGLREELKFRIQPELSFTGERDFYFGFRSGSQFIFLNALLSVPLKEEPDELGLSVGVGHQHSLYGRILLDAEIFNKIVWQKEESKKIKDVPMARLTLSYKPRRRLHFFAGCLFEFELSEEFSVNPSLNFGVRF